MIKVYIEVENSEQRAAANGKQCRRNNGIGESSCIRLDIKLIVCLEQIMICEKQCIRGSGWRSLL